MIMHVSFIHAPTIHAPAAFPLFNVCPVYSGDSGGSLVSMKSSWNEIMVTY